ncbi:MAG: bifunctional [glutamate--ammonia ligase]-adenylyl-L-tyrosine phosphorylase/[glutamate--ammonia-ligase] adenylyltransferase [Gammaproteobacteria bacterium]|nr:bifunctional [glutamate--ammonia ligase]-adenylyl-L-tyrosine phosphorylase/[glutamate--ammonia-ligase] adenylyltransferase [Gammaproteobacteria bacterium]MDH3448887.1 bifunctional [glutamate--ammonia ligase]-adenylyl-L-tyrosine phosphorylase/[glutamate--ammonia-ligase] adenylyltransferase [Gammaproteobacteria bacterium]
MAEKPDIRHLLADHFSQWREIVDGLAANRCCAADIEKIERLAVASPYAVHQMLRNQGLAQDLLKLDGFLLDDQIGDATADEKADIERVKRDLRHYRHRKLVEIIYLDVVGENPVETTLQHLSDLADQLIRVALDVCSRSLSAKHGQPVDAQGNEMQLNIIAMGKLGGRELNFSSDIDLICCFDHDGELQGYGQLSYQEYFARLVRLFSQVLGDITEDGFVYRVDLRLRPWGDSGPVVLSHGALEHYYQLHGREWEQYAMVKARVITGSDQSRAHLVALLKPFVYRRYHDYRVFEGLATLKEKIDVQARSKGMRVNIKIGPGGIREIEFFVQAFQILKGGRNRRLQSTGIFYCFDALLKYDIIDRETIETLRAAYRFLRLLENRIQMYEDQQTHDLPDNPAQRARIAATLGFSDWDELNDRLQQHRDRVYRLFRELFRREVESGPEPIIDDSFEESIDDEKRWDFIDRSGIADSAQINKSLNRFLRSKAWSYMSARAKKRFNTLLPGLLETIESCAEPASLFDRFMRLFSSIAGRSVYFELLYQNLALLEKLASLFEKSAWIADEVSQYPMLLENLIHPGERDRFDKTKLQLRLQNQLANVEGDTELELDSLRLFKREQTLVIASAELAQEIDAMQVGRYLSELAGVVLEAVYQLARGDLQQKFGIPECSEDGNRREANFSIIGYGKLGGFEMHYQSDLDLIFLHDSGGEEQHSNGEKCIENSVYFARLAQKIISMTSVLTGSGKLYEIDSRLRPEGSSGLLVSSLQAYLRYQLEKAWTWEHQALVRARVVAGSPLLRQSFGRIREQVLRLPREDQKLRTDIVEMREKIYRSKRPPEDQRRDLKQSRGTMVDIEFMVQYWVLANANNIGSDCLYSDNISLLNELLRLNLITGSQSRLVEIYEDYHRLLHESVLQNRSAEVDADIVDERINHVKKCWNECFGLQEN